MVQIFEIRCDCYGHEAIRWNREGCNLKGSPLDSWWYSCHFSFSLRPLHPALKHKGWIRFWSWKMGWFCKKFCFSAYFSGMINANDWQKPSANWFLSILCKVIKTCFLFIPFVPLKRVPTITAWRFVNVNADFKPWMHNPSVLQHFLFAMKSLLYPGVWFSRNKVLQFFRPNFGPVLVSRSVDSVAFVKVSENIFHFISGVGGSRELIMAGDGCGTRKTVTLC